MLESIHESSKWIDEHFFNPMYQKVSQVCQGRVWLAPFVGIADGVLTTIQGVAALAEALFKGTINLIKGNIVLGLAQIVIGGGVIALSIAPFAIGRIFFVTISLMMLPRESFKWRQESF
jgi:hypothetical protein